MRNKFGHFARLSIAILLLITGCAQASPTSTPTLSAASTSVEVTAAKTPTISETTEQATDVPEAGPTNTPDAGTVSATPTSEIPTPESSAALQFSVVPDQSTANYRVREQLASVNLPSDAVGITNDVTGIITIQPDGTIDSANSKFVVNVSTLQSDRSMRDNFLRNNTLQTNQYPEVTFVPTQVSGLSTPLPQSGDFTFQLTGDLTIRDVTRPVTWDVSGQIQDDQITAHASTTFTFEDFNLTQPRVPVVLSVEDNITLEADLVLQQVSQ